MTINALSQKQQPHEKRRVISENGITCVYEDKNSDRKLDLYSISKKAQNLFEPNTRIITYYDNDGDGLCDERKDILIPNKNIPRDGELVLSNVVASDGKELNANIERTVYNNLAEKPKMSDIMKQKQDNVDSSWMF